MKRSFADVLFPENSQAGYVPGDEEAHRAAQALADRFDAPTIHAVADMLAFLERVGGQFHIVTLREKDAGADDDAYQTLGLGFQYETRDARVVLAKPPKEVAGIAVSDMEDPPVVLGDPESNPEPAQPEEPAPVAD